MRMTVSQYQDEVQAYSFQGTVLYEVFGEGSGCWRVKGENPAAKPWDFRARLSRYSATLLPGRGTRVFSQFFPLDRAQAFLNRVGKFCLNSEEKNMGRSRDSY